MLVGVTRIGALRQRVEKGFAILGTAAPGPPPGLVTFRKSARDDGIWYSTTPLTWLGNADSRHAWMSELARAHLEAAAQVSAKGGQLLPSGIGVSVGGKQVATAIGADLHVLEVASAVEQEVLYNLLREHVPLLIALSGRSAHGGAGGSSRLAHSREHVAARYMASTSEHHLSRVAAQLRRADGVAELERMDIYPGKEPDDTLIVGVRCIDAAASLATTRAHAVLLAALAMRARRLVRDGRRLGNARQPRLEENRARAVARGMLSRLSYEDKANGRDQQTATRALLRTLLVESLSIELDNLQATPQELFPVVAPIELPQMGLAGASRDDELLRTWAASHGAQFPTIATRVLADPGPGGPCLTAANQLAPGRTSLLLDEWAAIIAARRGASHTGPARSGGGHNRGSRSQAKGRNRGASPKDQAARQQPRNEGRS